MDISFVSNPLELIVAISSGKVVDTSTCLKRVVVQTATQTGRGVKAGVKDYRLTYFMKDYKVSDTIILAAFRVIPQPGVPPANARAAIAAESSTGTWTTVWTDGLTSLDRYTRRCYLI